MSNGIDGKRTFWNSCPRLLGFFPESTCSLGQDSVTQKDKKSCDWFINSEQDHYCFWSFVRRVSDKEGFMEPLLQHEISVLLGQSSTKINATYKDVLEKIKDLPEYKDLAEIFNS